MSSVWSILSVKTNSRIMSNLKRATWYSTIVLAWTVKTGPNRIAQTAVLTVQSNLNRRVLRRHGTLFRKSILTSKSPPGPSSMAICSRRSVIIWSMLKRTSGVRSLPSSALNASFVFWWSSRDFSANAWPVEPSLSSSGYTTSSSVAAWRAIVHSSSLNHFFPSTSEFAWTCS